jgi:hypothetical protein
MAYTSPLGTRPRPMRIKALLLQIPFFRRTIHIKTFVTERTEPWTSQGTVFNRDEGSTFKEIIHGEKIR